MIVNSGSYQPKYCCINDSLSFISDIHFNALTNELHKMNHNVLFHILNVFNVHQYREILLRLVNHIAITGEFQNHFRYAVSCCDCLLHATNDHISGYGLLLLNVISFLAKRLGITFFQCSPVTMLLYFIFIKDWFFSITEINL
jgi:hypothetical protein